MIVATLVRQILFPEQRPAGNGHRPLHDVLELTHVPRVGVGHERETRVAL